MHLLERWLLHLSLNLLWVVPAVAGDESSYVLLHDDFSGLTPGMFSAGVIGAHAEYHYLPAVAPKGNWVVTSFRSDGSQRAWRVLKENGKRILYQSYTASKSEQKYTHAFVIAGDSLWRDYTFSVHFVPESDAAQSGIAFRYRNDQCYYFFGVDGKSAVLKKVKYNTGFRQPDETVLDKTETAWKPGDELTATVSVAGSKILARLSTGVSLKAEDRTFATGKIGLLADVPTRYADVTVKTSDAAGKAFEKLKQLRRDEMAKRQAANPRMVLWKKLDIGGFGVGRNLRFGDLDGDGRIDVLVGQMIHHGPRDRNSEVGCLTAMTFDGKRLWQNGEADAWKDALTNDVAVQIHDLNGDGRNEVVYCRDFEIVVADGATGKTKYKTQTPETPKNSGGEYNKFPRILGDCLYFCDLRGTGAPRDMIVKDRYQSVWAYNDRLELLWHAQCKTGHYPYASDVDGDGKDELAVGYSLFDHDGKLLWSFDDRLEDHADGVAIVRFSDKPGSVPRILCSASDEGVYFADIRGNMLKHLYLGHVQNPAVADFRTDLPGLEAATMNFWGNQGIVHLYDSEGNVYADFEPCQHGSMMLPLNWTGTPPEYFVLSAAVEGGGVFDGRGRKVMDFPGDGHPDMCNAVLDLTGDCRDEIVVWDPSEIWVYTQSDNPQKGRLYKPIRNPLYNESNYSEAVSIPGWNK